MKRSEAKGKRPSRPSIPQEVQEEVSRALDLLRASPRFEIVKSLDAGELLGAKGEPVSSLKDLTLGDLLSLGPRELCKFPGLSTARLRLLATIIRGLAHVAPGADYDAPSIMPEMALGQLIPLLPPGRPKSDFPNFSSTEAELKLLSILEKLRQSKELEQIAAKPLKDFWQPTWPSAPFEQQMTIQQILEIDIEAVLKKRSFTGQKLSAFLSALERALGTLGEAPQAGPRPDSQRAAPVLVPSIANPEVSVDVALRDNLSAFDRFALWGAKQIWGSLPLNHPVALIFSDWVQANGDAALLSLLGNSDSLTQTTILSLEQSFRVKCPALYTQWSALLSGPGVSFEVLTAGLLVETAPASLQKALLQCLLQSLGATEVQYQGVPVKGYWTLTPKTFEVLVASLASIPREPAEHFAAEVAAILPAFDPTQIKGLLAK